MSINSKCRFGEKVFIFLIILTSSSCMSNSESTRKDVSKDPKYWGGFKPGTKLILQQDLFLLSGNGKKSYLCRAKQDTGLSSAYEKYTTPSIQEYNDNPKERSYIIGILPKGAKIQINRLELFSSTTFTELIVYASAIDGPFANREIELHGLSNSTGLADPCFPKPEYLKEATTENTSTTAIMNLHE